MMDYLALPKIELHCHLDGSVRVETIYELSKAMGLDVPEDLKHLKAKLVAPETCASLDEYLTCFALPVEVMQSKEALKRITFELFEDAAKENIKYMEVRFGPLLHLKGGLSIDQVLSSVIEGMRSAEALYDIHGNIIISALRTMKKDRIYEMIEVSKKYLGHGITGFDLASSEIEGFSEVFKPYVDDAKAKGFHITIHAGETGVGNNVFEAIDLLSAERIGHGIYIHDTPKAFQAVKDHETVLEICPTSNVQTKAVASLDHHPIHEFIRSGLNVTINTDNRTVSDTTLTKEIRKIMEVFSLTLDDYKMIYENAVKRAFASSDEKHRLRSYWS